ncbi:MAG TPA: alpha/beta fold hydrolase, partial [Pirellulales bacterium]
ALHAIEPNEVAGLAKQVLASDDSEERSALKKKLVQYQGDLDQVLHKLRARSFPTVDPGYHPQEHFSVPKLLEEYPDDLLYFTVPKSYRADRPTGLIIFMHGGGNASSRRSPRYYMNFPDEDDDESSQLGDLFDATGMVAVGPSAPWDEESSYRWCLPEADDYLAAVILECKNRFNIDPDRVFLVGHSMGGFGAYHHVQRQPDRFAAVIVNAGSWQLGYWPVIRGTKLCIIQGVEDAEKDERWHYTDIEYARHTDKILAQLKLDYVYYEHKQGHWVGYGRPYMEKFFEETKKLRRDPFYPRIALASPVGYSRYYSSEVEHNRWLTLDEADEGKLTYDLLLSDDDVEFDEWRLTHEKRRRPGAAIEAENRGDNTIVVTTKNVKRFTVWLHPRMVDVGKPVTVLVDGERQFREKLTPSLVTAIESYERRHDWGLIYPIKIELTTPPEEE